MCSSAERLLLITSCDMLWLTAASEGGYLVQDTLNAFNRIYALLDSPSHLVNMTVHSCKTAQRTVCDIAKTVASTSANRCCGREQLELGFQTTHAHASANGFVCTNTVCNLYLQSRDRCQFEKRQQARLGSMPVTRTVVDNVDLLCCHGYCWCWRWCRCCSCLGH